MGDKIKKFIDCIVPVTTCNLRCHYCYITLCHEFDKKLPKFEYNAEHIGKSLSKERLGGVCCINFCGGGETLLPSEMTGIIEEVLKQGHYVMVVTNGTVTKRFEEIVQFDKELLKRLFFKFSFQYLELKRTNQLNKFFDNIRMIDEAGCSFSLEITPNDEIIPCIEEIKNIAIENVGAIPHVSVARDTTQKRLPILTKMNREEYRNVWGQFKSKMFEFKLAMFNKKRREFCYAGSWSYFLDLGTGDLKQCYAGKVVQNIYEDISAPIVEKPIGWCCPEPHCYNAHAWLTFGDIPELEAPTYLDMRNRETQNNIVWCKEPVKSFFMQKLKDNNKQYSFIGKLGYSIFSTVKDILSRVFSIKKIRCRYQITILGIKFKVKRKF